ncbi:hornerin-like [Iris pallida]|uniref:Hornerin-like n=1 Tax=Iris pallida TaxID=29817 RepID=A0AAX6EF36_IRIPA|nr:hornerin-like [Iris pallida]KAJ6805931.1 hornerin-like [Iris pallida]
MDPNPEPGSSWTRLSWDLTDLILSLLPVGSIIRSSVVCRHWRSVVADPSFRARSTGNPWFFLHGRNSVYHKQDQAFGYDPVSDSWTRLPARSLHPDLFSGAGGFSFACGFGSGSGSETRFSYAPLPAGPWTDAPPLSFSRLNPLVGVLDDGSFLVVGGARFIGGLVDIEDRLATELYDPGAGGAWEVCAPLPAEFRSGGSSSHWLSSCVLRSRRLLVVLGTYSGLLSAFDVARREWAPVRALRPAGVLLSSLVACGEKLVLTGLCSAPPGAGGGDVEEEGCVFRLWEVDYESLSISEIAVMPRELMSLVFEESEFASLRCVGAEGLVYVFNEDHHRGYTACVCEIGRRPPCRWRKLPPLPGPLNRFHKVVAFASPINFHSLLPAPPPPPAPD